VVTIDTSIARCRVDIKKLYTFLQNLDLSTVLRDRHLQQVPRLLRPAVQLWLAQELLRPA